MRTVSILFALTLSWLSLTCIAEVPKVVTTLKLGSIHSLVFTPDGTRAVAQLETTNGAVLQVIDFSKPDKPVLRASRAINSSGDMAISPDGRRLLMLTWPEDEQSGIPTLHVVVAFDLTDPDSPKELWRKELQASMVSLSPDASAYVVCETSNIKKGVWDLAVTWIGSKRPRTVVRSIERSLSNKALMFSDNASFLVMPGYTTLMAFDLRPQNPITYDQPITFVNRRYGKVIRVLETGQILIEDARADRLGIYVIEPGIPRVATVSHDHAQLYESVPTAAPSKELIIGDLSGRLFDLALTGHPRFTKSWQLPPLTLPVGSYQRKFLYTTLFNSGLEVRQLNETSPEAVDWNALVAVHEKALQAYQKDRNGIGAMNANRILNLANIHAALDAPVTGISNKKAAAILNDYGFLIQKGYGLPDAEPALRRAIALDPERAVAFLNLADLLRKNLSSVADWQVKESKASEIENLYRDYLRLGGRRTSEIENFLNRDLGKDSPNDMCRVIAIYSNAGRLDELLIEPALDIPFGNKRLDFVFAYEGTAHVPTFYAFNSADDTPVDTEEVATPDSEELWGGDNLGIVAYRNTVHMLHYKDPRHPVASSSLLGDQHCSFMISTVERVGAKSLEPQLCARLNRGESLPVIEFDGPNRMTDEDVSKTWSETGIDGTRKLDTANDGTPINVAKLSLSSGAGAGCEEVFFDQVDSNATRFITGSKRDLLMKLQGADPGNRYPILPCGNAPNFFKYGGKIYFETKPTAWPPIDAWNQYHRVTRVRAGVMEDVCDFTFSTTVKP